VQEKEMKGIQIGKEEVKLYLFAGDIILYLKDPKIIPRTLSSHKHFEQSSRIQNHYTKISNFSIKQQ
jgi:hypothetical protein